MEFLLSVFITSVNTNDVIVAIDTVDSMGIKRPSSITINRNERHNLCIDKTYHSKKGEQDIIKI